MPGVGRVTASERPGTTPQWGERAMRGPELAGRVHSSGDRRDGQALSFFCSAHSTALSSSSRTIAFDSASVRVWAGNLTS